MVVCPPPIILGIIGYIFNVRAEIMNLNFEYSTVQLLFQEKTIHEFWVFYCSTLVPGEKKKKKSLNYYKSTDHHLINQNHN